MHGRDDEALKDLTALLSCAINAPTGERFTCGHLYAEATLVGGAFPAVAVYGHTGTSNQPPRVMDLQTANLLLALLRGEYDLGETRTKSFGGTLADWRVIRNANTDDAEEGDA